ncbi:MAG: helix-turn-helix transcriptional regulator [Paramuribaculum sp.]|nr:helix-turn-helix transcriptional regulator [Paramuribaculum sp.]
MRKANINMQEIFNEIPREEREEARLSFQISNRLDALMREKGLSKKQLADAIGKRPSEITRWLSGEHNFTISTIAMLSTFFGKPIIMVQ